MDATLVAVWGSYLDAGSEHLPETRATGILVRVDCGLLIDTGIGARPLRAPRPQKPAHMGRRHGRVCAVRAACYGPAWTYVTPGGLEWEGGGRGFSRGTRVPPGPPIREARAEQGRLLLDAGSGGPHLPANSAAGRGRMTLRSGGAAARAVRCVRGLFSVPVSSVVRSGGLGSGGLPVFPFGIWTDVPDAGAPSMASSISTAGAFLRPNVVFLSARNLDGDRGGA